MAQAPGVYAPTIGLVPLFVHLGRFATAKNLLGLCFIE
jgi:hypothetical protein